MYVHVVVEKHISHDLNIAILHFLFRYKKIKMFPLGGRAYFRGRKNNIILK